MMQDETKIQDQGLTILMVKCRGGNHAPLTTLPGQRDHRVLVASGAEGALEIDRAAAHMRTKHASSLRTAALPASSPCLPSQRSCSWRCNPRFPCNHSDSPPAAAASGSSLHSLALELQQRVAGVENSNAQLERRLSETAAQLMAARCALEQEVTKRIWAEKELTEANLRLHDKAVRDALTGLYNRHYLEESLDREMNRATRNGHSIGVLMIDIDHFKQFNDTFGHVAGDAVLHAVGQQLLSQTRGEDILCRYGGEEFVLIMTNASARTAWERAEALRVGVQELKVEHESRQLGSVTLSIGIALLPDHGESWRAVLLAADAALYQAKQAGRNRVAQRDSCKPDS